MERRNCIMKKAKNMRKQLFALVLALAMVFTSVSVPSVTAEAAKNVKVKKIQITNPKKKTVTLVRGKTLQIKVKVTPKNAKNKKVTYKSSKKKIASVSSKGKVKGLKKGTAKITVTAKDGSKKKATLTVKVVNPVKVSKVTVSPAATTLDVGKTVTLKVACAPKNATNKAVSWKTSDKGVATVNASGVVKGVKAGTAKITATAKDGSKKSAACTVTVKAASVTPTPPTPAVKTLDSIAVTTAPTKTEYYRDEKFDPAGMEVTASYTDKSTKVLAANAYTLTPSVDTPLKTTNKAVTVSYTEGGVTKTATTPIKVSLPPTVQSISIENAPAKTEYMEGETFDPAGMKVVAALSNGGTKELAADTDYTYSKEPLAVTAGAEKTMFEISYQASASRTLTAEVEILVKASDPLESISAQLLNTVLEREGACFNDDDVKVTATFESGETAEVSVEDCTVDPAAFELTTTSADITYWYGGISKSVTVDGFTVTTYRERYTFEDIKTVGTPVKRANETTNAVPTEDNAADVIGEDDFVAGVEGNALHMDGTYGLRLDKIAGSSASKNYSISAWFKPEKMVKNQALIISTANKFGLTDGLPETWCAIAGNDPSGSFDKKLKVWYYDDDSKWQTAIRTASPIGIGEDAEWTHVALVVDDSGVAEENYATATFYVNGRKIGSGKVRNEKNELMKTYIGATGWYADGYYTGLVDELVFTSEVLTQDAVEAYYLEGVENSGKQFSKLTQVSADNGTEVEVEYGTSLADVKRELVKIAYKATVEGSEEPLPFTTTSDMWTLDSYTVTSTGEAEATVKLQAPEGYMFNLGGRLSVTTELKATVKIKDPVTVTAVTPSQTEIEVPYGTSEDAIKEALAELTFTTTTSDGSAYEIANAKSLWTLEADGDNYKAAFELKDKPGYKYADGVKVEVAVTVKQPIDITALAVTPNTLTVDYNTPEADVKDELAKLAISATVAAGSEAPGSISNTADMWTITDYNAEEAADYTAKAAVAAPVGYKFADGVGEVTVTVTVKPQGEHKLSSIKVTTNPRLKYIVGDSFDKTGMVVTAYYEDGAHEDVTAKAVIGTAEDLQLGTQEIEISYTEGEADAAITKTCTLIITTVKVEDGAAAHYGFDESLEDSKGGKPAVMATNKSMADNANAPTYDNGLKGKGISLGETRDGGIDQNVIRLGSTVSSANFTINIWANPRTLARGHALLLNGLPENAPANRQLAIYTCSRNNAKELKIFNGSEEFTAEDVWDVGTWSMVTWVNTEDKIFVYMNGKKIFEVANAVNVANLKKLFISGSPYDEVFDGYVDEVSIYDSSLSLDQVKALYESVPLTITDISVDAKPEDFTFINSVLNEDTTAIQDALKALKINVAVNKGEAPELANDTDWTLTKTDTGYTATKELTLPEGYIKADNVSTTLTVNVIVKDIHLESIAVTKNPARTKYVAGETFDKTGMEVTATYDDGYKRVIEEFTVDESKVLAEADTEMTVSYTESGVTKETTVSIQVLSATAAKEEMEAAKIGYYKFDGTLKNEVGEGSAEEALLAPVKNVDPATAAAISYSDNGVSGKALKITGPQGKGVKLDTKVADTTKYTVSMWVNAVALGETANQTFAPVFRINGNGFENLWFSNMGSPEDFLIRGSTWMSSGLAEYESGNQKGVLVKDTWKMLTLSVDNGQGKFYVDGEYKFSVKVKTGTNCEMYLGTCTADWTFNGEYDEVSIYNDSLLPGHIKLLYDESKPAPTE